MLLLGIDLGTSSIKVSVVDSQTLNCICSTNYPETETEIISPKTGWAEQSPDDWWHNIKQAILKANSFNLYDPKDISAIGISYQMHGLVVLDKNGEVLRNSIIWCDSRAVEIGNKAFDEIGHSTSLQRLLNSPGNFTASKLAWIKENEPEIFDRIDKIMLPGDFAAYKFTGSITTSISALSEGIFWDFKSREISKDVMNYYGFRDYLIPVVQDLFSVHGNVTKEVALELGLKAGIPVSYKSGDQPNNALSLNVLNPGEVAATAGTSGVIYGVTDELTFDTQSRVNTFAHVNYTHANPSLGVLLCINGTGILNRWLKDITRSESYAAMNDLASKVNIGADGLRILPFGNGAERMLENKSVGAQFYNLDFNIHQHAHLVRAGQEGIACSFKYGFDILQENKINPTIIRAGKANMFLSPIFSEAFVNTLNIPVELYNNDGSVGAAIGAGIGNRCYSNPGEAFSNFKPLTIIEPQKDLVEKYQSVYNDWFQYLDKQIQ